MRKSQVKLKLVEDLEKLSNKLNLEALYDYPNLTSTKETLGEIAAVFKNLDNSDYEEFCRLRKNIYPGIDRKIRVNAANEIDGFLKQKVAEYKRYDFSILDRNVINVPRIKIPKWILKNINTIVVSFIVALLLAWFKLN